MNMQGGQEVQCTNCGHMQPNPSGAKLLKCENCGTFFKVQAKVETAAKAAPSQEDKEKPPSQAKCPYCGTMQDNPKREERLRCTKCQGVFKPAAKIGTATGRGGEPNVEVTCTHCGHKQINKHGAKMVKCENCGGFFRTVPREDAQPPADDKTATCTHCGTKQENTQGIKFMRCSNCNKYFHTQKSSGTVHICNVCGSSDVGMITDFKKGIFKKVEPHKSFRCNNCNYEW